MKAAGFTLLEILLVLVFLGLTTAVVLPSLSPPDSASGIKTEAKRFAALATSAHEDALIRGKNLGIVINHDNPLTLYRFVIWQDKQWQPLTSDRVFTQRTLPEGIEINITPGDSVWKAALEEEAQNHIDDQSEDQENESNVITPDIYFWASGQLSPAQVRFQSTRYRDRYTLVQLEETGRVTVIKSEENSES